MLYTVTKKGFGDYVSDYAKLVYTARHTNNDIAEKCVCIFIMYFCRPIKKIDASHELDRSSQGIVNKTMSFGA